jgi:predicted CopG family antitoxin
MAHKTITISDVAYEALARSKRENESFTKVILRLTSERGRASSLLEHLRGSPADEELAGSIERAMRRTRSALLVPADLSRR